MRVLAIIDYGMGNLRSVQKGFARVGVDAIVTRDPGRIRDAAGWSLTDEQIADCVDAAIGE